MTGEKRHCMVVYAQYPLGETRVQREAEALVGHGYAVDVICLRPAGQSARDEHRGVRIFREPYRVPIPGLDQTGLIQRFLNYIRFFLAARRRLNDLHQVHPYDTIQVHNLPDFLVFCAWGPRQTGTPVIIDLHDLMPEFYAGRFGSENSLPTRLIRWQERQACRFADHVITVSEHWRQALIRRGVPPDKCSVVMNVADEEIFRLPPAGFVPREKSDETFRLFYHGTIVHRYGLDLAIRAVGLLRDEIPALRLHILGRGQAVPDLERLVRELGLASRVTIKDGLCPAEELPALIHAADLGVVPYRNDVFTDGLLPTKLMEYAASGLPAVAARTTAIATYFGDTMAELFEPNDAKDLAARIRLLYHDRDRLNTLRAGCRRFNERYNWRKIGAEYVSLVTRLMTRR